MEIFKAYDIRGVYPSELNEQIIEKIAKAFAKKTKAKKIVVGYDKRLHSPALVASLIKGLTDMGADVIDVGLATTPMFYFAVAHLKSDAGMMVTASHNPSKYNGIKMTFKNAIPFGGDDIQELKKLVDENNFEEAEKKGEVVKEDIFDDYKKKIISFSEIKNTLKVVSDTGNGMAGLTVPKIFAELPLESSYIYDEIDLSFPNHEANPLKTDTLKDLQEEVKKQKADIGLAFDGDGDRVGFVDENGNIVPMDLVGAMIAGKMPGQKILFDIRSSMIVKETIAANNGECVPHRVGHYFIKETMREKDIPFGLEVSGHYYFKELAYTDSAIFAAIKVLNILSESEKSFSELMKEYQKYFKIDETNFEVEDKDAVLKKLEAAYSGGTITHVDGIKIEYEDWWFNLRKSNTEPLIRLNLEAKSKDKMKEELSKIKKLIEE